MLKLSRHEASALEVEAYVWEVDLRKLRWMSLARSFKPLKNERKNKRRSEQELLSVVWVFIEDCSLVTPEPRMKNTFKRDTNELQYECLSYNRHNR